LPSPHPAGAHSSNSAATLRPTHHRTLSHSSLVRVKSAPGPALHAMAIISRGATMNILLSERDSPCAWAIYKLKHVFKLKHVCETRVQHALATSGELRSCTKAPLSYLWAINSLAPTYAKQQRSQSMVSVAWGVCNNAARLPCKLRLSWLLQGHLPISCPAHHVPRLPLLGRSSPGSPPTHQRAAG